MLIKALIQARMSSSRYPGKVLAPLNGKPLIIHVFERVKDAVSPENITVLTSLDASDDPLVYYLQRSHINIYRGSLINVYERFKDYLRDNTCDYFFRVCGDSPLLERSLFRRALSVIKINRSFDIVTNVFPRTFPHGKTVELIKTTTFLSLDTNSFTEEEKEHVTTYFYSRPDKYSIYNIERRAHFYKLPSYTVDTVDDLKNLERFLSEDYQNENR